MLWRKLPRLQKYLHSVRDTWAAQSLRARCSSAGEGLAVIGPCEVSGGGRIDLGNNVCLRSKPHLRVDLFVAHNAHLSLGNNVLLNLGTRIVCTTQITVGNRCLIGDECFLIDNDYHAVDGGAPRKAPIILDDGVWLANRVVVLRGVTIGAGSVVGANSVVTRSIPPHSFAVGAPARVVRTLQPRDPAEDRSYSDERARRASPYG